MKQRLLLIFTVWFLMTAPAFAGSANVPNFDTFGELLEGPDSHTSTGGFDLTVTSKVYKYTGTVNEVETTIYTYVWTLQATSFVTLFTVDAHGFDYDYGAVGAPFNYIANIDGNLSFSLFLNPPGTMATFYAQSAKGPGPVEFWASGGSSSSSLGDPDVYTYGPSTTYTTAVPEPSTLSLLGFGLLAAGFFRKRFSSPHLA